MVRTAGNSADPIDERGNVAAGADHKRFLFFERGAGILETREVRKRLYEEYGLV